MLSPEEVAAAITAAAIAMSKNLSSEETNFWAAVFGQLSNTLVTIAAVKDKTQPQDESSDSTLFQP